MSLLVPMTYKTLFSHTLESYERHLKPRRIIWTAHGNTRTGPVIEVPKVNVWDMPVFPMSARKMGRYFHACSNFFCNAHFPNPSRNFDFSRTIANNSHALEPVQADLKLKY